MAFIAVDGENFQEVMDEIFENNKIAILKFGSEYCESCHALECELEDIDDEYENVSVLSIDTDESPELAEQYEVYKLPTMVIYKDKDTLIYNKGGVILSQDIEVMLEYR
jgi:thioredoxin 1